MIMNDLHGKLDALIYKTWRLRRHVATFVKYASPGKIRNMFRIETELLRKKVTLRGKPYFYLIDPASYCILKCPMCPTAAGVISLPKVALDVDAYRVFLDKIAPFAIKIDFYNWGEPFLHKEICTILSMAHRAHIATAVSSTCNVLPRQGAEALVASGLDDLVVSCDGLTQETYEKYRVGGKLATVIENMKSITRAKEKLKRDNPCIEFQFLAFRHNEHEIPRVEAFAHSLGIKHVRITSPYLDINDHALQPASNQRFVRPEYRSDFDPTRKKAFNRCFWLWRAMVVNANGQVDPCCSYFDSRGFGNVFFQPFDDVWNGEAFRYARSLFNKTKDRRRIEIVCEECVTSRRSGTG